MEFNYQKICQDLIKDLPSKQKEIVSRRFALSAEGGAERETLESIGESFGVTRERIRQIEENGLETISPKIKKYQDVFLSFKKYFQNFGGVRKEETALEELGGKKWGNQVYFLLTLAGSIIRSGESKDFLPTFALSNDYLNKARKTIDGLYQKLEKAGKPIAFKNPVLESYLGTSKKIQKNSEGVFGLMSWPEINPRGIKDRALLVFKKEQRPLHFTRVSELIRGSLVQTVHNELIRDANFVLVGRGIYALKEWGYQPGQVKDVIQKTLIEGGRPLGKAEILDKVLKQRLVKENTVFLNLSNKKYFSKNSQGKYWIREA